MFVRSGFESHKQAHTPPLLAAARTDPKNGLAVAADMLRQAKSAARAAVDCGHSASALERAAGVLGDQDCMPAPTNGNICSKVHIGAILRPETRLRALLHLQVLKLFEWCSVMMTLRDVHPAA